jgi:hypothetical protein
MEFINAVGGVTGNVASPYSLQTAPLGLLENVASSRNVTGEGWGDVWVKVCVLMVVLLLACLRCNCVYSDFYYFFLFRCRNISLQQYDQRLSGAFSTNLNLVDFPFDKQKVVLKLESSIYDATQVDFIYLLGASKKALPAGFDILEWSNSADPVTIISTKEYYPLFEQYYSRYTVTIDVVRVCFCIR